MDILSIRKKGKKPQKPGETSSSEASSSEAPASSSSPSSSSHASAPPQSPQYAPQPTHSAQAAPSFPALPSFPPLMMPAPPPPATVPGNATIIDEALPPLPATSGHGGAQKGAGDPLRGFLAHYDEDDEGDADAPLQVSESSDAAQRFLSFRLVDEDYAASIMDIREILTIRSLTEVPRAPKEVLGVVSKRGVVLPVIDLATSLNLRAPERRLRAAQRVLVVGDGDRVCGLRVDAVSEVIKLQAAQIEEVPASLGQKNAGLLLGLGRAGGAMYILLDVDAVLDAFAIAMGVAPTPRAEG